MRRVFIVLALIPIFLCAQRAYAEEFTADFNEPKRDYVREKRAPDGWQAVTGKGYPAYNSEYMRHVFGPTAVTHEGAGAVRIAPDGGNAALETRKLLRVDPFRSYAVSGWVKVEGMDRNRALISVLWYDRSGLFISESWTDALEGTADWSHLSLLMPSIPENARFARVRLSVIGGGFRGSAWFDDIQVEESYQISVDTRRPANVYFRGDDIVMDVVVRGAEPGLYRVEHSLVDHRGEVIKAPKDLHIQVDEIKDVTFSTELDLPHNGAYRYRMRVIRVIPHTRMSGAISPSPFVLPDIAVQEVQVGEQEIPLGRVESRAGGPARGAGLVIRPNRIQNADVYHLIDLLGCRHLKVHIWDTPREIEGGVFDTDQMQKLIRSLKSQERSIVGVLSAPPDYLPSDRGATITMFDYFADENDSWSDPLAEVITNYRTSIGKWQLGADQDLGFVRAAPPQTRAVLEDVMNVIRSRASYAQIGIPGSWPSPESIPVVDFMAMRVAPEVDAGEVGKGAIGRLFDAQERTMTLAIREVRRQNAMIDRHNQAIDLVRKLVRARAAGEDNVYVTPFWDNRSGLVDGWGLATEAFYAFNTYQQLVGDLRYEPQEGLIAGVSNYVFRDSADRLLIVLWADAAESTPVRLYLGENVKKIGLMGKVEPLQPGATVTVGIEPMYIVDVDAKFVKTQLSTRFDPTLIPLQEEVNDVHFKIQNYFDVPMRNLKIRLSPPPRSRWEANVEVLPSAEIQPGEEGAFPVRIRMPRSEVSGTKVVQVEMTFTAGQNYHFVVTRSFEIRPKLHIRIEYQQEMKDNRLVSLEAIATITNYDTRTVDLNAYALAPWLPRGRQFTFLDLAPNESQSFRLKMPINPALVGKPLQVSVREVGRDLFSNAESKYPELPKR